MSRMSFRTKLTLLFLITTILEGVLIGYFSYAQSREIVIQNKKHEMADTINRIDININVRVRTIMGIMDNTVASQITRDLLADSQDETQADSQKAFYQEYFAAINHSLEPASNILLLQEGRVVCSNEEGEGKTFQQARALAYSQAARENPSKIFWIGSAESLFQQPGEPVDQVVTVVRGIPDETGTELLGVMVVELEPDTFGNLLLSNQKNVQYQYTFIVDNHGQVICSNKNVDTSWFAEIEPRFEQGNRQFTLQWGDKSYYVCGQYNGLTSWKTYSIISIDDIFPQSRMLRQSIIFLVAACTLGVAVIIAILSYALTRPINRLSDAMDAVRMGDLDIQLPNRRQDEIGRVISSFNFMVNKIGTLVKEVYQQKLAQKNAELKALQAQINPHFLYNTLDCINWMLIDKGEDEISEVIISLGKLMRYCIDTDGSLVTLEQEFQYVISYLHIQKTRLEERLEYEVHLSDDIRQVEVPKLILQPLVENAITHGIEPCGRPGVVRIKGYREGDNLYITVEDNGAGMDQNGLDSLRQEQLPTERDGHTRIGMRNVDKRIQLYYGEEHRLHLRSTLGQGTLATICIPAHTGREELA